MKTEQFYWMDDGDGIAVGSFDTVKEAQEDAIAVSGGAGNHTRTYTILKGVAVSTPPSLARKWKAA